MCQKKILNLLLSIVISIKLINSESVHIISSQLEDETDASRISQNNIKEIFINLLDSNEDDRPDDLTTYDKKNIFLDKSDEDISKTSTGQSIGIPINEESNIDSKIQQNPETNNADKDYYEINEENEDEDSEGFIARKKNFLDHYYDGVQAYLSNDWEMCISLLERSVALYHEYYDAVTFCRISCEIERNQKKLLNTKNIEERRFHEGLIRKTLCLEKCRRSHLGMLSKWFSLDNEQKYIFKERKPYQYLQLCYFREEEFEKAVQATYTAIVANPGDELMKKNIKYYSTIRAFNYENLKDLEDKEFSHFFQNGVVAYENKQWKQAIENFEKFIEIWIREYEKCRAFCEGEYYQGWAADFTSSMANHYVYSLRCKQNCTKELSFTNGVYYEDLFPSAYDYLQFSYYQDGDIKKGAGCVGSYLLFYPNSEEMLESFVYYKSLENIKDDYFTPRQEADKLIDCQNYETELLKFVDHEFTTLYKSSDMTFRQQSVQSDLSKSENLEENSSENIQNVKKDNYINFTKFLENYKNKMSKV